MDLLAVVSGAFLLAIGVLIMTKDRRASSSKENSLLALCESCDAWYREFKINGDSEEYRRLKAYDEQLWAEHRRRWPKEN